MSSFDNLLSKAKAATQKAGKKANEMVEITKLNLEVSDVKSQIDNIYRDMGKAIYETYQETGAVDEPMQRKCMLIDEKYKQIEEINAKLGTLKNVIICPKCSEQNPIDNIFCAKCGQKLTKNTFEDTEE